MSNNNTFSLKKAITQHAIDAKLSTGKFINTGAVYSPTQAVSDASNASLRLKARVSGNNTLSWSK